VEDPAETVHATERVPPAAVLMSAIIAGEKAIENPYPTPAPLEFGAVVTFPEAVARLSVCPPTEFAPEVLVSVAAT
jgi:hypothetical protein